MAKKKAKKVEPTNSFEEFEELIDNVNARAVPDVVAVIQAIRLVNDRLLVMQEATDKIPDLVTVVTDIKSKFDELDKDMTLANESLTSIANNSAKKIPIPKSEQQRKNGS